MFILDFCRRYFVRVGSDDNGIGIPVKNVIEYDKYNENAKKYDMALALLSTPLEFSEDISAVPIQNPDHRSYEVEKPTVLSRYGESASLRTSQLRSQQQCNQYKVAEPNEQLCGEVVDPGKCTVSCKTVIPI